MDYHPIISGLDVRTNALSVDDLFGMAANFDQRIELLHDTGPRLQVISKRRGAAAARPRAIVVLFETRMVAELVAGGDGGSTGEYIGSSYGGFGDGYGGGGHGGNHDGYDNQNHANVGRLNYSNNEFKHVSSHVAANISRLPSLNSTPSCSTFTARSFGLV